MLTPIHHWDYYERLWGAENLIEHTEKQENNYFLDVP